MNNLNEMLLFFFALALFVGLFGAIHCGMDKVRFHMGEKTKEKTPIFECQWFSLVKDGHYFYIDYGTEHAGVVIVPIVDNTHILFVKNYRYPLSKDSWELPRGFIDKDETFIQAALRELVEETAYQGISENCSEIGFIAPDSSILNNSLPIVKVSLVATDKTLAQLDPEISQVEKVELSNLDQWLKDHLVIDGITLAALMKYRMS